jgi:hypothetical protein
MHNPTVGFLVLTLIAGCGGPPTEEDGLKDAPWTIPSLQLP